MANVAPQLALMIGLGVGIDYALFIVTRFRESYLSTGSVHRSVLEAMDTSGRASRARRDDGGHRSAGDVRHRRELHVRAGDRLGPRGALDHGRLADAAPGGALARRASRRPHARPARGGRTGAGPHPHRMSMAAHAIGSRSRWRRWSVVVQSKPWPLAIVSLAVMIGLALPALGLRLATSDAGNDPAAHQHAARLRPAGPRVRRRIQRAAGARGHAPRPGRPVGRPDDPRCGRGHDPASRR